MDSSPPPPSNSNNWDLSLLPLDLEDDILSEIFDLPLLHPLLELPENKIELSPKKRSLEEISDSESEETVSTPPKVRKVGLSPFKNVSELYDNPVAHCSKNPPPEVKICPITENDLDLLSNYESVPTPSPLPSNDVPSPKPVPSRKRNYQDVHQEDMIGHGNEPPFEIISETHKDVKKYNAAGSVVTFKFRNVEDSEDFQKYLEEMFSSLVDYLTRNASNPNDRIGLTIYNRDKPDQRPIGISLRRVDQLNADVILQTIEQILQSNEAFFVDGVMEVST